MTIPIVSKQAAAIAALLVITARISADVASCDQMPSCCHANILYTLQ
jgi:hypothetical protein